METQHFSLLGLLAIFFLVSRVFGITTDIVRFDENYEITWGYDHVLSLNQGREIQLSMDLSSG